MKKKQKIQKTWLITGAARGLGLEIVRAVLEAGDRVVAAVRKNPEALIAQFTAYPDFYAFTMDITNEEQVNQGI